MYYFYKKTIKCYYITNLNDVMVPNEEQFNDKMADTGLTKNC